MITVLIGDEVNIRPHSNTYGLTAVECNYTWVVTRIDGKLFFVESDDYCNGEELWFSEYELCHIYDY